MMAEGPNEKERPVGHEAHGRHAAEHPARTGLLLCFRRCSKKCRRNLLEPLCTDPYARWCGRGRRVTCNYGWHILGVVLYEMATGTLPLRGEMAVMVSAGGLRQPPRQFAFTGGSTAADCSQLRAYSSLPFGPGVTGSCSPQFLLRIRRQIYETNFPQCSSRLGFTRHSCRFSRSLRFGRHRRLVLRLTAPNAMASRTTRPLFRAPLTLQPQQGVEL